jgi:hypothetical protein
VWQCCRSRPGTPGLIVHRLRYHGRASAPVRVRRRVLAPYGEFPSSKGACLVGTRRRRAAPADAPTPMPGVPITTSRVLDRLGRPEISSRVVSFALRAWMAMARQPRDQLADTDSESVFFRDGHTARDILETALRALDGRRCAAPWWIVPTPCSWTRRCPIRCRFRGRTHPGHAQEDADARGGNQGDVQHHRRHRRAGHYR